MKVMNTDISQPGARDVDVAGLAILEKAHAIVATLAERGESSAQELATAVDEPVSSTYRLLSTLTQLGWIESGSKRGSYRLGVYVIRIGGQLEDRLDVRKSCQPFLEGMRQQTKETAFLCYRRGNFAVCVERIGGRDVQSLAMRLGDSLPLTHGAAPLAILAFLPEKEREAVIEQSTLDVGGAGMRVTPDDVRARIDFAREHGYSLSDGDVTPGIAALGAPIYNHRGELEGAVSLSGLRERVLDPERDMAGMLLNVARSSSHALGYQEA